MSQLRSMISELTSFDPDDLSTEELVAEITEALFGQQLLQTAIAGWVKNLADREGHVDLGYPSPTALLTHLGRMSGGHARQVVAQANASEKAPYAYTAWEDGRLSTDQAKHVFSLAETVPDEFPSAEERLVEIVEGLSVKETRKAVEYWRQSAAGPGRPRSRSRVRPAGPVIFENHGRDAVCEWLGYPNRRRSLRHCLRRHHGPNHR